MEQVTLTYADVETPMRVERDRRAHVATGRGRGLTGRRALDDLRRRCEELRRDDRLPAPFEMVTAAGPFPCYRLGRCATFRARKRDGFVSCRPLAGACENGCLAWTALQRRGRPISRSSPGATFPQEPQTEIARQMYDLHTIVLVICLVIFVGVFAIMFYSVLEHRKAAGHKAEQFHENVVVEIAWTIVPFLILIGMAWPATKTVIAMKDTPSPDLTIKAAACQWKRGYDYPTGDGPGISFYSSLATPRDQREGKESCSNVVDDVN